MLKPIIFNRSVKTDGFIQQLKDKISNGIEIDNEILVHEVTEKYVDDLSWNDIVVLLFDSATTISPDINKLLNKARKNNIYVLLVSTDDKLIPPDPFSNIKAVGTTASDIERILNRIYVLIGLKLRKERQKIFISYRASDGERIANQLYDYLSGLGFVVWLDKAKGNDEFENIEIGDNVQEEIERNIEEAALILLLDTEDMPQSRWIAEEVRLGLANTIPIYPVHIRKENMPFKGIRNFSLKELHRYIDLQVNDILNDTQLDGVFKEIEQFILDIFKIKNEVIFNSKAIFERRNFSWGEFDRSRSYYESEKKTKHIRNIQKIFSHCSHYDGFFSGFAKSFGDFISTKYLEHNYKLFIYGGSSVLTDVQIQDIYRVHSLSSSLTIIHHQELESYLLNGFSVGSN